jgi:2-phosphoglycerate kinase
VKAVLELKVKKRDGDVEPWSYDKLLSSIVKSGVELQAAKKIATEIESWAKKVANENLMNSISVRDKVIELVGKVDPVAADTYSIYKKE